MTEQGWAATLLVLNEAWRPEMTETQALVYRGLLEEYSDEELAGGLRLLIEEGRDYRPSAAALVRACLDVRAAPPPWLEAWAQILAGALEEMHPTVLAFCGYRRNGWRQVREMGMSASGRASLEASWERRRQAPEPRRRRLGPGGRP
jgi:hypothetical protein